MIYWTKLNRGVVKMKKTFALVIALVMLFALSVPAFAETETRHFTMKVTGNSREVFEGDSKASLTMAGEANAKLFTLLEGSVQDRNGFETMTVDFDFADRHFTVVGESLTTHSGLTYTVSAPETVFMDTPAKLHATGTGDAVITVTDSEGNQIDEYTVTAKDGKLSSVCSKCGGEQGDKPHLLVCGHYSCEDDPDHADCTEHIHTWALCWEAAHWNGKQSYPFYRCSICGAEMNYDILPPVYYNPWAVEEKN